VKYYYTLYGLLIESMLPLPELLEVDASHQSTPADVRVILDRDQQYSLPDQKTQTAYPLQIPDVGRYFIDAGHEIIVQPDPDTSDVMIRLYLLGTAFGLLLYQRGLLPFHASSVETPHGAVLIAGNSGVGKSTTAAAFHQKRGYRLIADDVSVTYVEQGYPYVLPAYPQVKLWSNSLQMLELPSDHLQRVTSSDDKFAVPIRDGFLSDPTRICALFVLVSANVDDLHLMHLSYAEKVLVLQRQLYRIGLMRQVNPAVLPFDMAAAFLQHVQIARILRPQGGNSLDSVLELIEQSLTH